MKFYTIKTPIIIQKFFSNYYWRFSSSVKEIYLTFDDGPTPEITTYVLNELKKCLNLLDGIKVESVSN